MASGQLYGLFAVIGDQQLIALVSQCLIEHLEVLGIVVNQQNTGVLLPWRGFHAQASSWTLSTIRTSWASECVPILCITRER